MGKNKKVVVIVGPTASGKTALSLQLAHQFKTSIISADSRQCYRELNIGVAKPTTEELKAAKHYFINSHSIHDNVTASIFEQYALQAAQEIFLENDIAIMAGGTGLYIKAFCEGLDFIPEIPAGIRQSIIHSYQENGIGWLQQQVKEKDPEFWGTTTEPMNPHRLIRALEVILGTGKSILFYRRKKAVERGFDIIKVGIDLPKTVLHANIETRINKMMGDGLLHEVKTLLPKRNMPALQTVGYQELLAFFDDKISLNEATKLMIKNTQQYAKRQLTWFKHDKSIQWLVNNDIQFFMSKNGL